MLFGVNIKWVVQILSDKCGVVHMICIIYWKNVPNLYVSIEIYLILRWYSTHFIKGGVIFTIVHNQY